MLEHILDIDAVLSSLQETKFQKRSRCACHRVLRCIYRLQCLWKWRLLFTNFNSGPLPRLGSYSMTPFLVFFFSAKIHYNPFGTTSLKYTPPCKMIIITNAVVRPRQRKANVHVHMMLILLYCDIYIYYIIYCRPY